MKRVFIIHAWDESPESCWYPWLKKELETQGIKVEVPAMPNPATPDITAWVSLLSNLTADVDEQTYFVGHSIGCQTILRYLEKLPDGQKIGGAIFVAPWTQLTGLSEASRQIADPWIETPINWQVAREHCPQFFAFLSDNDQWVPLSEEKVFQEKLGAQTRTVANAGHFDGMTELPEVLAQITQIVQIGEIGPTDKFADAIKIMANTPPISNEEIIKRNKERRG